MPSHARVSAPAHAGPQSQPRSRTGQAAWSDQLAASPRQRRQAGQLRSLFGERAESGPPTQPVAQGMFLGPEGQPVQTAEAARLLAQQVIALSQEGADIDDMQRNEFEQALVELATSADDHRQLSLESLQDLLVRGRVRERFAIEQQGRRLHTTGTEKPNFPPGRSATAIKLDEVSKRPKKAKRKKKDEGSDDEQSDSEGIESKGDFTYRDLRAILDTSRIDQLTPQQIEAATLQAVTDWRADTIGFSDQLPVDVQLVVQHLLHYHSFNSPMLKGRYRVNAHKEAQDQRLEREAENRSRRHELDKSKRLLVTDSRSRFMLTMPPDPVEGHMDYAFSGLQDVNRPLPDSALQGAAYKAVYLCVKKVLRSSLDIALGASPLSTGGELDARQRLRFNRALVELMPDFEKSTVTRDEGSGVRYVRETIGLSRFSAAEELSDEDSASSEDEDLPLPVRRTIVDERSNVEANEGKIKTWSATIGTLSKLSLQKQLIDQATLPEEQKEGAQRKHQRRRRKLERHVRRVSRQKHLIKTAQSELNYLNSKRDMLRLKMEQLDAEWDDAGETMRPVIEYRRARVEKLLGKLNTYYADVSVGTLAGKDKYWKRSDPFMRRLGKQGLQTYMTLGEPEVEEKEESSEKVESPKKKKRKLSKKEGKRKAKGSTE